MFIKKILPIIIVGIVTGVIGFSVGQTNGYASAEKIQSYRGVELIKSDLKQREIEMIATLLDGSAQIETRSEGGLFNKEKSRWLTGKIQNNALLAKAKDVKVIVKFLSKTNSEIGKAEFTIYEYIEPKDSQSFEKKVDVSEDVAEFSWNILEAKAE